MKEFSQTVLVKGLFVSIKGHYCLTKGHLVNPEATWRSNPPHQKLFLMLLIQIKKKIQRSHSLTERQTSVRFIFLKQSLIDKRFAIPVCFIISNSDSNQFEFSYLTKLLSTFKVRPSLDAFHSQLSDEEVRGLR